MKHMGFVDDATLVLQEYGIMDSAWMMMCVASVSFLFIISANQMGSSGEGTRSRKKGVKGFVPKVRKGGGHGN